MSGMRQFRREAAKRAAARGLRERRAAERRTAGEVAGLLVSLRRWGDTLRPWAFLLLSPVLIAVTLSLPRSDRPRHHRAGGGAGAGVLLVLAGAGELWARRRGEPEDGEQGVPAEPPFPPVRARS